LDFRINRKEKKNKKKLKQKRSYQKLEANLLPLPPSLHPSSGVDLLKRVTREGKEGVDR